MKTINLTVIGDMSCSTTRTYLTFLRHANLRPYNLWLVRFNDDKRRAGWRALEYRFRRSVRRADVHKAVLPHSSDFRSLCEKLMTTAAVLPVDLFGPFDYEAHAERVDYFAARDYADRRLQARMMAARDTAFLYTNGGIVPQGLLRAKSLRILHMHPGVVPQVRGSDCFLWSCAVRGRPGVSCFYMSAGIDEGELIQTMEFHCPDLSALTPHLSQDDDDIAYRALLFAIDPQVRGQILVDVLRRSYLDDTRTLPCHVQRQAERPAYLWLHPSVRAPLMQALARRSATHSSGKIHAIVG